jgi:hypothetical protein
MLKKYRTVCLLASATVIYGLVLLPHAYRRGKANLHTESERIFYQTIDVDRENRLNEMKIQLHFGYISDDAASKIIIEQEGISHIHVENTDSIRNLSLTAKNAIAQQTILAQINPLNIIRFDSLFNAGLRERNIRARTIVCYTNDHTGEVFYSNPDTLFHTPVFVTSKCYLDIDGKISVQSHIGTTFFCIIRNSDSIFTWGTSIWLLLTGFLIYPVFRKKKPQKQLINLSDRTVIPIRLDKNKCNLTCRNKNIKIAKDFPVLVEALLKCPEYYATYNDLIPVLYGNINVDKGINRLHQLVSRSRRTLEANAIMEITMEPCSKGYQLRVMAGYKVTV